MLKLQRIAAWMVVAGTVAFLTTATLIGAWPLWHADRSGPLRVTPLEETKVSSHDRDIEWHRRQIAECRALMAEVNTDPAYRQCREYVLKSLRESVVRYEAQLARLEELQLQGR